MDAVQNTTGFESGRDSMSLLGEESSVLAEFVADPDN